MQVAKFQCPQCHNSYTIKSANIAAMAGKMFTCPKCRYSSTFGQLLRGSAVSAAPSAASVGLRPVGAPLGRPMGGALKTRIGGGELSPVGSKTRIAPANTFVTLEVLESGKSFPLEPGIHTLGRQSSDSKATIQVAPDKFMSRLQARIEARNAGGKSVRIFGENSANPVFVNDRRADNMNGIELKNGDTILLGMTKVKVHM